MIKDDDTQQNKLKKYTLEERIGIGSCGEVWKATENLTKNIVAIKIIKKKTILAEPKLFELLQSEIKILLKINNPNVVNLYDAFLYSGNHYLVMEYCFDGDLEQYLSRQPRKRVSGDVAIGFLSQLINGFRALEEISAMHRDFKPANVFMNNGVLKIGDFGYSKLGELASTALGTDFYMAPEILKWEKYSNKVDVWSLGVCFYEMLFGKYPFNSIPESELLEEMEKGKIDFKIDDKEIDPLFKELISKMLQYRPEKRISWIEIFEHPLLFGLFDRGKYSSLELKYRYYSNSLVFQSKVIYDAIRLNSGGNAVFVAFLLSKRLDYLSNKFYKALKMKKNFFYDDKVFGDFIKSPEYEKMVLNFFQINMSNHEILLALKKKIKNYETSTTTSSFLCLEEEIERDPYSKSEKFNVILKAVIIDYLYLGQSVIINRLENRKEDSAREIAIHLILTAECLNWKQNFAFDENATEGFEHEEFVKKLEGTSTNLLKKLISKKCEELL